MTSANLLCGYYAVIASLMGTPDDFNHAAKAIGIAIVFDSLDGRIARMTGTNTEFGVQFDSLADVVSFGIAPAVLAYAWGVRSVTNLAPDALHQLGRFGWLCCLAFLICCAWRLARFNVQGMAPGGKWRRPPRPELSHPSYMVFMPEVRWATGAGPFRGCFSPWPSPD